MILQRLWSLAPVRSEVVPVWSLNVALDLGDQLGSLGANHAVVAQLFVLSLSQALFSHSDFARSKLLVWVLSSLLP